MVWSFDIHSPLSERYKNLLEDTSNRIVVSQISLMELAIKKNINKLPGFIPDIKVVADRLINNGFEILNLTDKHIFEYQHLPLFAEHKDPFDRFLIAIAKYEYFTIMSTDNKFKLYPSIVEVI